MRPRKIKLIIDSSLDNVPLVGNAVNKICSLIPLSEVESYQTEVCIVEACNNVIKHAYRNESNHEVEVIMSLHSDKLTFEICDTGHKLEKRPVSNLDFDPKNIEKLPEGGMGLFIMHNLMNEVDYRSVNGTNVLTLSKNL